VTFPLQTDNHIKNGDELSEAVRADVWAAIGPRFDTRPRRVDVYFEDVNGAKGGVDTRCAAELHPAGHPPAAEDRAKGIDTAAGGAVDRVLRVVEKQLGRQGDRSGHTSAAGVRVCNPRAAWGPITTGTGRTGCTSRPT
jgi:hypothetical protein